VRHTLVLIIVIGLVCTSTPGAQNRTATRISTPAASIDEALQTYR